MGVINYGSQEITFQYKNRADSTSFDKLLNTVVNIGVYSGFGINKIANNSISINPGVLIIDDSTGYTVRLQTSVVTAQTITASSTLIYVVARYSYLASVTNYVDFLCTDTPLGSDVILGKLVYSGATLTSVDYSYRTYGNLDKNKIIIDSITNSLYLQPGTNFWFINNDGYIISYKQIFQKTFVATLSSNSNYYLLYDGASFSAATTVTGLAFSTAKNGWYDTSYKRVLALVNSDGASTITPISVLLDNYGIRSIDTTLAANSDYNIPTEKAVKTYAMPASYLDIDGTMAADSDTRIASQKATVTYVKNKSIAYALVFG